MSSDSETDFEKTYAIPSSVSSVPQHSSNRSSISQSKPRRLNEDKNEKKVVISNLKEPYGNEKSREMADRCTIQQILYAIGADSAADNIKSLSRVGSYDPNGAPRDVFVCFKSEENQREATTNAQKLKNFPDWLNVTLKSFTNYDPEKEAMQKQLEELQKQMAALLKAQQASSVIPTQPVSLNETPVQTFQPPPTEATVIPQKESVPQVLSHPTVPPPPYQDNNDESAEYQEFLRFKNSQASKQANSKDMTAQYQEYLKWKTAQAYRVLTNQTDDSESSDSECDISVVNNSDDDEPEEATYENELLNAQVERHVGTKKIINILVLGESGVGKSTWINAIANYMTYNTLDDALEEANPICLIPCRFEFYETATKLVEVKMEPSHGDKDENEVITGVGEAATQGPKTYQFETAKYVVRFIDTPGIGDRRGIKKDYENTEKILSALGNYKDLHAICFLFKANDARASPNFRYCISQLLLQLNKDAINNIIFFFTNARDANYSAGDTYETLEGFFTELEEKNGLKLQLTNDNTCCSDNESFRLVCAHSQGVRFLEKEFKKFEESWKRAVAETQRFLELAAKQPPNRVADMVSINKARTIINYLAKPLADANQVIEANVLLFEQRKKDLENTANNLTDLKKKIKARHIAIEKKDLDYPKTACKSVKCTSSIPIPNTDQKQTLYKTICHDHCYLTGIRVEVSPEPGLRGCAAMHGDNCQGCSHHWSEHVHIRFEQQQVTIEVEDKATKELIKQNEAASVVKKKLIDDCQITINEYKAEQKEIIQISLRFGSFIQRNALMATADAFEKYVEHTIEEEENLAGPGGDRTKLNNLKRSLNEYRQAKIMLEEAKKSSPDNELRSITPDEIEVMKTKLFGLKHSGATLKKLFEATGDGVAMNNRHATVRYVADIRKPQPKPKEKEAKKPTKSWTQKNSKKR